MENNNNVVTFDLDSMTIYGERATLSKEQSLEVMNAIENTLENYSNDLIKIAYGLLLLDERADFKKLGYTSMSNYATTALGMSKGGLSDTLKVAKRFRASANEYRIAEQYKGFTKSALLALAKSGLDDDEIASLNLESDAKYVDVIEAVEERKRLLQSSDSEHSSESENGESSDSEHSNESENSESSDSEPTDTEVKNEVEILEYKISEMPAYVRQALQKYVRGQKKDPLGAYELRITLNQ